MAQLVPTRSGRNVKEACVDWMWFWWNAHAPVAKPLPSVVPGGVARTTCVSASTVQLFVVMALAASASKLAPETVDGAFRDVSLQEPPKVAWRPIGPEPSLY